jgi:hypothetical protein
MALEKGVAVHLWRASADLALAARADCETDLTSWRDALPWAEVERRKGAYGIPPAFRCREAPTAIAVPEVFCPSPKVHNRHLSP